MPAAPARRSARKKRPASRAARKSSSTSGQPVKLGQPLDWVAVTDHSDGMGVITEIKGGNPEMMADPTLKRWHDMMAAGPAEAKAAVMELIDAQANKKLPPLVMDPKFATAVWAKNTAIAEKYNEPGRFTAFIGYEWTSNAGGGDNLHRNVIYRDGKDKADRVLPYTTFQSENPEDLWKWMTEWEKTTGGKLLAIPHNGNLSNGRMFALSTFAGDPMSKAWAEERQKWEPLFEAIQMKGQSESHPSLSTTDEFAVNYELWDRGNLVADAKEAGHDPGPGTLREALKNGLKVEQDLGANPFKYGMAGGTDTHNGLTAAEEDNFFAKFPSAEPRPDRWSEDAMKFGDRVVKGWEMTAAGYTAVWATGNTPRRTVGRDEAQRDLRDQRPAHDRALLRRLRLHRGRRVPHAGGRRLREGRADGRRPAARPRRARRPTFLVAALKDPQERQPRSHPDHQGLARQGRHAAGAHLRRRLGRRRPPQDRQRQADPVGSTVDVANAIVDEHDR